MPLKKPTDIPRLPRAREKKGISALDTIPTKKPDKKDYLVKGFFRYEPILKKQFLIFAIETITEFTSFAYEISVETFKENGEFYIVLMGLKAKTNIIPRVMPARTEIKFDELNGDFKINVLKKDGAINSAHFYANVLNKELVLKEKSIPKKKNNRFFCDFEIAKKEFSFREVN
ncbi:MAG: hypothetical protein M0P71_09490 [Melioribacteraceae bacterium]|nr:hypothetical protein [Melioribacteraceae bacterium]